MKLIPISERPDAEQLLYALLQERTPIESISHKRMPTWDEHIKFVRSNPYRVWYFIQPDQGVEVIGAIYLTDRDEVGVHVFRPARGQGFASEAIQLLMSAHGKRRYLANVAPGNKASQHMFERLGFRHIQNTFALETE